MILWVFVIASFIMCCHVAPNIGTLFLYYALIGCPISICLSALVSMLLGKTGQYQLTDIIRYSVKQKDEEGKYYLPETGEVITNDMIASVQYSRVSATPYVKLYVYDLVGWRRQWLLPVYPPRYEIVLMLPSEDET